MISFVVDLLFFTVVLLIFCCFLVFTTADTTTTTIGLGVRAGIIRRELQLLLLLLLILLLGKADVAELPAEIETPTEATEGSAGEVDAGEAEKAAAEADEVSKKEVAAGSGAVPTSAGVGGRCAGNAAARSHVRIDRHVPRVRGRG